jgi:hypothetical protein
MSICVDVAPNPRGQLTLHQRITVMHNLESQRKPSLWSHMSTSSLPSPAAALTTLSSFGIPSRTDHAALSTDATTASVGVLSARPVSTCACRAPRQVSAHASRSPSATWPVMAATTPSGRSWELSEWLIRADYHRSQLVPMSICVDVASEGSAS